MAKARVAVLISGAGTNMAALLYAAKAADCPYELVLVTGDNPEASGLSLAEAEGDQRIQHAGHQAADQGFEERTHQCDAPR